MADIFSIDHLQPCLLDRLTDDEPHSRVEGRAQRTVSPARFKEGVLRDLRWLFNTQRHLEHEGLAEFPEVEKSVFNFGVRDPVGVFSEGRDLTELERELHETILRFEPRIIRRTLRVQVSRSENEQSQRSPHRISLQIAADLWAQPLPEKFFAKTEIDPETGEFVFRS
jgi:type VI secretion system protein ImpF